MLHAFLQVMVLSFHQKHNFLCFFFVSLQLEMLCSCSTHRLCIRAHFQQIILWLEVTYQRQPTMNPVLGVLVILQIIWVKCDELHVVVRGECLGGGGGWGGSGVPDWPWGGQKPLETRSAVALHLCLLFLMFGEMPVEGLGGGSGGGLDTFWVSCFCSHSEIPCYSSTHTYLTLWSSTSSVAFGRLFYNCRPRFKLSLGLLWDALLPPHLSAHHLASPAIVFPACKPSLPTPLVLLPWTIFQSRQHLSVQTYNHHNALIVV